MVRLRRGREGTTTGRLLGVDKRRPLASNALEPRILIQTTPAGEARACQLRKAVLRRLALRGSAQEAKVTGLIAYEEGFDRVARLLATVVFLLCLWSGRAVEWSRRASMPTRGGVGTPCVRSAASPTAKASAGRAGSRS